MRLPKWVEWSAVSLAILITSCDATIIERTKDKSLSLAAEGASVRKIIVLKDMIGDADEIATEFENSYGIKKEHVYKNVFKGFSISLQSGEASIADDMSSDLRVDYVANDASLLIRPVADEETIQQLPPTGITRIGADKTSVFNSSGDKDVTIAVIDTGIDSTNPQLNVTDKKSFITSDPSPEDQNGHGTHVSGTIAARNIGNDVVGIVPGAKLWSMRVLDKAGHGFTSDIIAAIDYVTGKADMVDVVNMSLSGAGSSDNNCGKTNNDPYHTAICASVAKGIVYVAAASNDGSDAKDFVPAAYKEVVTVSAISDLDGKPGGLAGSADDTFTSFSNYGEAIDFAAPGVKIKSLALGGSFSTKTGTSMAAPHVTGSVALYILLNRKDKPTSDIVALSKYAEKVKVNLQSISCRKGSDCYFTGDKDAYAEPLINVAKIENISSAETSMSLALDKPLYLKGTDTNARVSIKVLDGGQNLISHLAANKFTAKLNSTSIPLSITEQNGTYTATLALGDSPVGSYTLSVSYANLSATAVFKIQDVQPIVQHQIHLYNISYKKTYLNNRATIRATLEIRDEKNLTVSNAKISVQGIYNNASIGKVSNLTNSLGEVNFYITSYRVGCYRITPYQIGLAGYLWDKGSDVVDHGICITSAAEVRAAGQNDAYQAAQSASQNKDDEFPAMSAGGGK